MSCKVTIHTKSATLKAKYGPFIYCGKPLVRSYDVCRRHLRVEIRAVERSIPATEKWLAKARAALLGGESCAD